MDNQDLQTLYSIREASRTIPMPYATLHHRVMRGKWREAPGVVIVDDAVAFTEEFIAWARERKGPIPRSAPMVVSDGNTHDAVTRLLKKGKLPLEEIADALDLSPKRTAEILDKMAASGIDIRMDDEIELRTTPVAESLSAPPPWGTANRQRFLVTADWHLLNRHSRVNSLRQMYDYAHSVGCQFILHCGDLDDGSPHMHKGFEFELLTTSYDEHREFILDTIPRGLQTLVIDGNHDLSWYKDAGIGLVSDLCRSRDDLTHAGIREAFLPGPTGRPNLIYLSHPGDGKAYSKSYKVQKTAEWLHDAVNDVAEDLNQRDLNFFPQLVFIGHYHSYCHIRGPYRSHMFTLPAMCGMTAFQRDKHLYNEVGFMVIDVTFDDDAQPISVSANLHDVLGGDEMTVFEKPPKRRVMVSMDGLWA